MISVAERPLGKHDLKIQPNKEHFKRNDVFPEHSSKSQPMYV